jgi:putative flippase GtrA
MSFARINGQPARFVVAGALTALIYIGGTLLLSGIVGVPIQVSIALAYVSSLAAHFSLQRFFVFRNRDAFALAVHQQAIRYLGGASAQYAFAAVATAVLPSLLGVSSEVAYVLAAVIAAAGSFLFLRRYVFHGGRGLA